MSGICAVWRMDNPARVDRTLAVVTRGLSLVQSECAAQESSAGAGVGVSAVFATQQTCSNGRVLVACDADLYNEPDLTSLIGGLSARSESAGTAALIAALYERFGPGFVEKLNGNFSLVIWDPRERKLIAAVDGFGVNRLVYWRDRGTVLVASRIDALMGSGEIEPEVNARAVVNFMNYGANLAPGTIFEKVQRLTPGTVLIASESDTRITTYWNMSYVPVEKANTERLSRQLESVVENAVKAQCKSDSFSDIGAFLSGGTDSSTVVGMMSRLGRGPVKTFSIGFEEQRFNELGYAEITARKFQTDHHTYLVSAADCLQALPHMVRFFDEPFANSSAIPTYFCGRLAAEKGVRVLLAGDGGDELFGGNERYLTDKVFQLYQGVPLHLRKRLIEPVLTRLPMEKGPLGKARRYVRRSNIPAIERFFSYNFLCAHPPEDVFERDFLASLQDYSVLQIPFSYYRDGPARDHLDRLLYVDVKITLGDSDLPKVTQMSELAGIQTRFPFLDRLVAEFSGSVPSRLKVRRWEKRYLFKRAFRNLLPPEVIKKKKHGFGIPVAYWLKSDSRMREFSRDILFSSHSLGRGYFRRDFLEELIRMHEADDTAYYGDTLWSFLVLELWHRQFIDQPAGVAA